MKTEKTLQNCKSIREFAYATIKRDILNLSFSPNQKITELELVDTLKIGKTPIREALILLAKEGLITIAPQSGSFIAPIDFARVEEGREIRSILEENIHLQAMNIMTKDDISACEAIINKQTQLPEDSSTAHWFYDEEFHKYIYKTCDKEKTFYTVQLMNIDFNRVKLLSFAEIPKPKQVIEEHCLILEAIAKKDADLLKEITHKHLNPSSLDKEKIMEHYPTYFMKNK